MCERSGRAHLIGCDPRLGSSRRSGADLRSRHGRAAGVAGVACAARFLDSTNAAATDTREVEPRGTRAMSTSDKSLLPPQHGRRGHTVEPRVRGLPPRRRPMGAPAVVHGMRSRRLLRQLTEPPRHGPLACASGASPHPFLRTGRGLVVVLHRRAALRAGRRPARAQPPLTRGRCHRVGHVEAADATPGRVARDGIPKSGSSRTVNSYAEPSSEDVHS